ncbi:hypothetical protein GEM_4956 [Burkholderia cepacia GG4]|uniref:Uncharacterized protein n=2 Tax=Burkholderia cepacia TaxID=292 RepID=A0A9W3K609_BURCE|nr:hypothetical protein GEM_4956 [Burkholderia cepacia GG4]
MSIMNVLSFAAKATGVLAFAAAIAATEMALIKIFSDEVGYLVLVAFIALAIVAWRRTETD